MARCSPSPRPVRPGLYTLTEMEKLLSVPAPALFFHALWWFIAPGRLGSVRAHYHSSCNILTLIFLCIHLHHKGWMSSCDIQTSHFVQWTIEGFFFLFFFAFACPHVLHLTHVVSRGLFLSSGGRWKQKDVLIPRVPQKIPPKVSLSVANPSFRGKRHICQLPVLPRGGRLYRWLCVHLWFSEPRRFSGHHRVSGRKVLKPFTGTGSFLGCLHCLRGQHF